MKIAAVICEFNPFHNGHKYLISKAREYADCVVAIMSGNFVQRGDIAVVDKYKRTESALQNGCDLVVELPTVFAVSSAQDFAKGGVDIAKALFADHLCFGAEDDDIDALTAISDAFNNTEFCEIIKKNASNGEYYPKAVSIATKEFLGKKYSDILENPNNTLAIEYIKALKNCNISPVAIKRIGAKHDSNITDGNIASATHIRNLITNKKEYSLFTDMNITDTADISKLETAILYKLRTMTKEQILNTPDVEEGLENRIFECARCSNSLEELYSNLKTKRYTMARIRRIVINALLGITKNDKKNDALYVRVLGMNDNGAAIIKNCSLPIVAKVKQDYNKLSINAKHQFDIDVMASEIFSLALDKQSNITNDFTAGIIKL